MEYYADNGKIFATDEVVNTDARKSFISFEVVTRRSQKNFPNMQEHQYFLTMCSELCASYPQIVFAGVVDCKGKLLAGTMGSSVAVVKFTNNTNWTEWVCHSAYYIISSKGSTM